MKFKMKKAAPKLKIKPARPLREPLPPVKDDSEVGKMSRYMASRLPAMNVNNPRYLTLEQIEASWILNEPPKVIQKIQFKKKEKPTLKLVGKTSKPKLNLKPKEKERTLWFHEGSSSYEEVFGEVSQATAKQCDDVTGITTHELEYRKQQKQKPKLQLKPKGGKPALSLKRK